MFLIQKLSFSDGFKAGICAFTAAAAVCVPCVSAAKTQQELLAAKTLPEWLEQRTEIVEIWEKALGTPSFRAPDTESVPDAGAESNTENKSDAKNESDVENESDAKNKSDAKNEPDAENESDAEPVSDAEMESDTKNKSAAETVSDVETVREFQTEEFRARVLLQKTGPKTRQKMVLLKPLESSASQNRNADSKVPGVVVPYYDPDRMCGYDLKTSERLPAYEKTSCFGLQLVRQGYIVLCVEAYPYNLLPDSELKDFPLWAAAAETLHLQEPDGTGMRKLTSDVRHAVDFLVTVPEVDPNRIAAAGHSLGGKMSFYAGCLDERVRAIIASDFGFRWEDTNWDAPWYWGEEKLKQLQEQGTDHRSLLALHAPNLFILIAGEADNAQTEAPLRETERIFRLYTDRRRIYFLNHASGHQPTRPALRNAWKILAEEFEWNVSDSCFGMKSEL